MYVSLLVYVCAHVYSYLVCVCVRVCVQVIHHANDVQYGLCASVWSENSGITHRVAQAMNVRTAQLL